MNYIIYSLLCFLQPICLPIPEAVTYIYGVETIGANNSFILGLISTVFGIITAYSISKVPGGKLKEKMASKDNLSSYMNFVEDNVVLITGMLFIVPVLPDEVICIGSGIIGLPLKVLVILAVFSKAVSISLIVYSGYLGTFIGINKWCIMAIEIGILFLFAYFFKRRKTIKTRTYDMI